MRTFQDINGLSSMGSPDGLGATLTVLGDDAAAQADPAPLPMPAPGPATAQQGVLAPNPALQALKVVYLIASPIGVGLGAYHGYKRNESVGWALAWAFLGGLAPFIVVPVAFAQGLGERK